jgi:methionine aminotransferase
VFAEKLVKDYGVAVIPMSAFYHDATDNKVIRLCFAKKEATLEAAAACLQKL